MPTLSSTSYSVLGRNPYNICTGGVITEYVVSGQRWRLHSFESAGLFDFTVLRAMTPIRLTYVGAGGGGGAQTDPYNGGGGDGGYGGDLTGVSISVGTYPVLVGSGGVGNGGATTVLGYTGAGGVGGADGNYASGGSGTTRGPLSNIRDGVTNEQFGLRGGIIFNEPPATPYPGHGASGAYPSGGTSGAYTPRIGSGPGGVWIAYPIAG